VTADKTSFLQPVCGLASDETDSLTGGPVFSIHVQPLLLSSVLKGMLASRARPSPEELSGSVTSV
jgi:hypothetical protein